MTPVRLEPAAPRSQVKHSTTEPLGSPDAFEIHVLCISKYYGILLKILWKIEHLLEANGPFSIVFSNKCSIFHSIFKSIQNFTSFFLIFFFNVV